MKSTEIKENFHSRLRRLRQQRNLTARDFAKLIGVPQSTYSDWENGKGLKLPPYELISQVLAVSVCELVLGQLTTSDEVYECIASIEKQLAELKSKVSTIR